MSTQFLEMEVSNFLSLADFYIYNSLLCEENLQKAVKMLQRMNVYHLFADQWNHTILNSLMEVTKAKENSNMARKYVMHHFIGNVDPVKCLIDNSWVQSLANQVALHSGLLVIPYAVY